MTRTHWLAVGGAVLCFCLGMGVNHFARPARVETKVVTQVEYRDRIVEKRVEGPVRVVTKRVEVPGPQGPTVTVERIVEKDPVVITRDSEPTVITKTETKTLTVNEYPRLMLGAQATTSWKDVTRYDFTGTVGYRFAGPLSVLASVGTDTRVSLGLALTF